jgi:dTDP-4-amino-4,6-dideoxygalactose transaminase
MDSERLPPPHLDAPPLADATRVAIACPELGAEERDAVLEVLDGHELVKGPRVAAFEREFAAAHGAAYGVATSSGATALLVALLAHGVGPGDEVIVPSFGFFATAAAVSLAGATPVFADIEPASFCLSPSAAEAAVTPRTKAILPVHLFGMPAELAAFADLTRRLRLVLLEDAAQAHGASYGGRTVGSFGTAAFSFYATKNMTTLEGGMVLTSDPELARRLRLCRNHGREGAAAHELIGGNFRMNELAAAIGRIQLRKLPAWTAKRREHARYLRDRLDFVSSPLELPDRDPVYHQFTVRVPAGQRARLMAHLDALGIDSRIYYPRPIHAEPAYSGRPGWERRERGERSQRSQRLELGETERACREVLSLPVHSGLNETELERIVAAVASFRPGA